MGILALGADERVAGVTFTADTLNVTMKDGRTITVPLHGIPGCSRPPQNRENIGRFPAAAMAFIGLSWTKI